jgi:DNA-binding LacI/PurR family transcriptional regulator
VSITEVAKIAGVSTATVSRVINQVPDVRPETADQVRAAMRSIGYTPPKVRRGPKLGPRNKPPRAGQIAVITVGSSLRSFEMPRMGAVLTGVTQGAREAGARVLLDQMCDESTVPGGVLGGDVAGAIVCMDSPCPDVVLNNLSRHVPVVWISNGETSATRFDHVSVDDAAVGHLACRYLRDQGCERLAYITSEPDVALMRTRGQSFANAAADDGRSVTFYLRGSDPALLGSYGGKVIRGDGVEDLVRHLVSRAPRPDGLFVPTDLLASQVYPLLYRNSLVPGKDICVITTDSEQLRAQSLVPPPAAIDIGSTTIGLAAVRQLLHRAAHPADPPQRILIAPKLVQ